MALGQINRTQQPAKPSKLEKFAQVLDIGMDVAGLAKGVGKLSNYATRGMDPNELVQLSSSTKWMPELVKHSEIKSRLSY